MPDQTKKNHPETVPLFVVEDVSTMQALSNPVRWDILDSVGALGECSAADIAEFTGRARTSLYPHIQQLVEYGLIYETGTRLMGKRYEQLYRPKATNIGTRVDQANPDNVEYHINFANSLARLLARKHQHAAQEPGLEPRTEKRNHHCGGISVWVDQKQLAKLNSMIEDIWNLCENSHPGGDKQLLHLGLFLSRHVSKSKDSES